MSDRTVRVRYEAIVSNFIAEVQAMEASQDKLTKSATNAAKKHDEAWKKISTGAAIAGGVILAGVGKAVAAFVDFDAKMSAASAATGATGAQLDELRQLAIKMGADTQFSASEAADAITEMGKAGVSTADIMGGGLKGALDLAAAGQLDVGRAGEIAATAMNQFGLAGKDIPHVADLLAAAAGKAQGSVEDVANALKYVGPVAKSMGLSIEETTGVIGEFAAKGILGEQAGTSLRGVLLSLTAPSDAAAQTMKNFGISIYDAQGHTKSYADIAQTLHDQLSGVDEATRNAALGQIFGNAQITAATILYEGGAQSVQDWTKKVNDAGFAQRQAAQLTDNLKGDIERLGGSLDTVFIQTGSSANTSLRSLVQGLEELVNEVGNVPGPLLLVGSAALGLSLTLPKALRAGKELKTTLDVLRTSSIATSTAMRGLGAAGAIAAAAFASVEIQQYVRAASVATPATDALAESLIKVSEGGKSAGDFATLFASGVGPFHQDFKDAADAIDQFGRNANAATNSTWYESLFGTAGEAQAVFSKRVQSIDQALVQLVQSGHGQDAAKIVEQLGAATEKYGGSADKIKESFTGYNTALAAAGAATGDLAGATTAATGPADSFAGSLQDQEKAAQDAADALDRARKSFIDYGDTVSGALNANVAYRQAVADANAALLDQKGNLDKTKLGFDVNTQAGRDNTLALTNLAQKAKENALAAYDQTQKTDTLSTSLKASRAEFVALAVKMGASTADANRLADQLGVTTNNSDLLNQALSHQPAATNTKVNVDTAAAKAAVDGAQRKLDAIDGRVTHATVTVDTSAAFANVRALAGYIDGIRSKTVHIDTYVGTYAGKPAGAATGGYISGPGTSTSDSIPAMLSDGEYVIKAAAVDHYGAGLFDRLNAMHFADGGFVARSLAARPTTALGAARTAPLVHVEQITTTDTAAAISVGIDRQLADALAAAGLTLEGVLT